MMGKKWAIPIIEEIALGKFIGFNQFSRDAENITATRLSAQLKELEQEGIIEKLPVKRQGSARYKLTEKGEEFHQVVQSIKRWNIKWNNVPESCFKTSCNNCEVSKT